MSTTNFKAKYEEYINLMKSIPKDCGFSLEMIPCKENRVFLRVCTHHYSYGSYTNGQIKMFFMIEVYDVKEMWAKKIWVDSFGVALLKKVKGTKKIPVTFEILGKSIVVQGSMEYIPTVVRFDEEGSSYEKTQLEAVQTLTNTPTILQQVKTVFESIKNGGKDESRIFLIIETFENQIIIASTNGNSLTVKNTGVKVESPVKFELMNDTIQALFAPYWNPELPLEIKMSKGNKDFLVCQKGRGKIWHSDADKIAPNYRGIIPTVFDYGHMQVKLPLIPKGMFAVRFTWEKLENGESKLHLQQEFSVHKPKPEGLIPWEAGAEILESNPIFPKDIDKVTWAFDPKLFCEGLKITDDKKKGVKFSMMAPDKVMSLQGNGYDFYIMPLNG